MTLEHLHLSSFDQWLLKLNNDTLNEHCSTVRHIVNHDRSAVAQGGTQHTPVPGSKPQSINIRIFRISEVITEEFYNVVSIVTKGSRHRSHFVSYQQDFINGICTDVIKIRMVALKENMDLRVCIIADST